MIEVTDLQGHLRFVNAEKIEIIEANPDTQILLENGHRLYAKENPAILAERVIAYRQQCLNFVLKNTAGTDLIKSKK